MRVALVPRSTEIKPSFWRFVQQIIPPYVFSNLGDRRRERPPICLAPTATQ